MEIRELHGAADMQQCEDIQREVWGMGDLEVVPTNQLIAALHAGSCLLGAWQGDKLVGFVYGFPAYHPEQTPAQGMHSHMMAVLPEARGLGLGKQLKWAQRDWCLTRGLTWITWTFDPLQARNARLNFEHFGALADHYLDNVYGELTGTLNSGLPSDRLLAMWHLHDPQVDALERGEVQPDIQFDVNESPFALENNDGEPAAINLGLLTPSVRVAVPADVSALKRYAPEVALKWRLEQRRVFHHYFANGYRIRRFVSGVYLLIKETSASS
ncbi:MAG: GNAT family N-acetyltransferase [Deinococcota bacterium]